MKIHDDNLNDLLRGFAGDAEAEAMAEDIRKGDALLDRFCAPALDTEALRRVRERLGRAAAPRYRRRLFLGWTSVAASVMAVMLVMFGLVDKPGTVQPEAKPVAQAPASETLHTLPGFSFNLWDDTRQNDSADAYAAIKEELDNIAASIEAARTDRPVFGVDPFSNGDNDRDSTTITTDFWKG